MVPKGTTRHAAQYLFIPVIRPAFTLKPSMFLLPLLKSQPPLCGPNGAGRAHVSVQMGQVQV